MRNFKSFLEEKTLTPAEKKKREEIAKAIERDNPDMPMAKKMAIATATAKKVAEVTISPLQKIRMDKEKADRNKDDKAKTQAKRMTDKQYAGYKVKMKEEAELDEASDTQMGTITVKTDAERKARAQAYRDKKAKEAMKKESVDLDELSKETLGSYVKKAKADNPVTQARKDYFAAHGKAFVGRGTSDSGDLNKNLDQKKKDFDQAELKRKSRLKNIKLAKQKMGKND